MKKIALLTAIVLSFTLAGFSQVTVVLKKDSVIVRDTSGNYKDTARFIFKKFTIYVVTNQDNYESGNKWTVTKTYGDTIDNEKVYENEKENKEKKFTGYWTGVEFAMNNYFNNNFSLKLPDDAKLLELNTGRSWGFNINFLRKSFGIYKNYFGIVTGMGFALNSYNFNKQVVFLRDSTPIKFALDTVNRFKNNRLVISYLTIPLLLEWQIPTDNTSSKRDTRLHLSAGLICNIKLMSEITQSWYSKEKYESFHDFNLNPVKLEASARIGYGAVSIFGNYSINTLFENNKGPALHPFSLGLGIYF